MKVSLFIGNSGLKDVDLSNILDGNPGIGGTQYMFFLLAHLLSVRENDIDVMLYCTEECMSLPVPDIRVVSDVAEAYIDAKAGNSDFFIMQNKTHLLHAVKSACPDARIPIIVWCHNFSWLDDLDIYSKEKLVERLVCVSKEQMDLYMDHRALLKSDYIFNGINVETLIPQVRERLVPSCYRNHVVTYMGSLVPWKGFHVLAKAWGKIVANVPDAQLYVIGSGCLYSRNNSLGHYGIASAEYEEVFMPYLVKNGAVMDNVHFCGLMGLDKYEILKNTKVGVVNPSGISETFGISAVEMQLMGARLLTKKCAGFIDTVRYGRLLDNEEELADNIIEELLDDTYKENDYFEFALENFSLNRFSADWERLLKNIGKSTGHLHGISLSNPEFYGKRRKYYFYQIASRLPFLYMAKDVCRRAKKCLLH